MINYNRRVVEHAFLFYREVFIANDVTYRNPVDWEKQWRLLHETG